MGNGECRVVGESAFWKEFSSRVLLIFFRFGYRCNFVVLVMFDLRNTMLIKLKVQNSFLIILNIK